MDEHKLLAIHLPDLFQADQLNDDYVSKGHDKAKSFSNKLACFLTVSIVYQETRKRQKKQAKIPREKCKNPSEKFNQQITHIIL
eukprot:15224568-Ditylum_brightwellii.AAC.1